MKPKNGTCNIHAIMGICTPSSGRRKRQPELIFCTNSISNKSDFERIAPADKIFTPPDSIEEVEWKDIEGKVMICEASKRPFKITQQEFDFYKKFHIPLPRLHPEIRLFKRYPQNLMFNLHEAQCDVCKISLQTSMADGDVILCEKCYLEKVG